MMEKISLALSKVREFYRTLYNDFSTFEFIFVGALSPLVIMLMLVAIVYAGVEDYNIYVEKKACEETNDHIHCPVDMSRLYIVDARKCVCVVTPTKE
jgi:hypothetical protein